MDVLLTNETTWGKGSAMTGEIQWKWWSEGDFKTMGCRISQQVTANHLILHGFTDLKSLPPPQGYLSNLSLGI